MKGESDGPGGTILKIILVLFKLRDGSALLHCCLGWGLEAELRNAPSPQPPLLTQLLSPRHNLSHRSPPLAEWWGNVELGRWGKSTEALQMCA